jgi:hypothetical protein
MAHGTLFQIPCYANLTHYDMQVVLDDVTFTLEFRWNTREQAWYMHVKQQDDTDVLDSVKIVINWPLAARYRDPRLPLGYFLAVDSSAAQQDPGISDLGDRVQLYYVPVLTP